MPVNSPAAAAAAVAWGAAGVERSAGWPSSVGDGRRRPPRRSTDARLFRVAGIRPGHALPKRGRSEGRCCGLEDNRAIGRTSAVGAQFMLSPPECHNSFTTERVGMLDLFVGARLNQHALTRSIR